jgi:hypothetical protein
MALPAAEHPKPRQRGRRSEVLMADDELHMHL